MARFLLALWPYPTHLRPNLALAEALRRRGHETAFFTGGDALELVRGQGFRAFPFRNTSWREAQEAVDRLIAERRNVARLGQLWKRFLVGQATAQVEDLEAVIAGWRPDAIVCDLSFLGPFLLLHEKTGIPVAMLSHVAHCLLPGPCAPTPGALFSRGAAGPARLLSLIASWVARRASGAVPAAASEMRQRYGLSPLQGAITELAGSMPLYLVPSIPQFDYSRSDLPSSVRYVGTCLWAKPASQPPPPWVASLPRDRPIVLVEEGALYTREAPLLEAAVRGLADLPYEVVALTGEGRAEDALPLPNPARNVHVRPWTPLVDVLPLAEIVVSNANSDSVLFALDAGKPLVAVPSMWDQAETAHQIEDAGVGVRLPLRRLTPERLAAAVKRVLQDGSMRSNAERMGAALRAAGGADRAARFVEELAARSSGADR